MKKVTYANTKSAYKAAKRIASGHNLPVNVVEAEDDRFALEIIVPELPEETSPLHQHILVVVAPEPEPEKPKAKTVFPENGLHKSEIESPCQIVWSTCDEMYPEARRKDVLEACMAKGVAYYTARTQIQLWHKAQKDSEASKAQGK